MHFLCACTTQELWEKDEGPSIFPVTNKMPAKSQFIPSKWEAKRVAYLVRAIKKGWLNPNKSKAQEKPRFYDIWADSKEYKQNPTPLTVWIPFFLVLCLW